jgi:mRNA-degrading endonuclease HigB of HigAB toxin-antitoxin module
LLVRKITELLFVHLYTLMRLLNKKALEKLRKKNRGNVPLSNAIDKLIKDVEDNEWKDQTELNRIRPDADCVQSDGFYFFNLNIHRTMILIEFEDDEATVVWAGTHQDYEKIFKNNKNTIKKWLSANDWI